jgi:hypothetical protein
MVEKMPENKRLDPMTEAVLKRESEKMNNPKKVEKMTKQVDDITDALDSIEGLSDFIGDPHKEDDGVWQEMNDETGREFLVAHGENPKFQAKLTRIMKPHMGTLRKRDEKAILLQERLSAIAMSGTVLLGWRTKLKDNSYENGIKLSGNAYVPFAVDLGEKILTDRRFRKFKNIIEQWAGMEEAYEEESNSEASGNS